MKLNLGCGKIHKKGYVNIDVQEPCDLKHDLRDPLPFTDKSIEEVYTNNVIQLFSQKEWGNLKHEIARVLIPGGKLEIYCDDFEYVAANFLNCKDDEKKWGYRLMCIFSGQGNEYDYFKNIFTYDKLVSDFKKEGMENFIRYFEPELEGWIHFVCYKKI